MNWRYFKNKWGSLYRANKEITQSLTSNGSWVDNFFSLGYLLNEDVFTELTKEEAFLEML